MVTGVRTNMGSAKLAPPGLHFVLAVLATAGCGSSERSDDVGAAVSAEATQVKPAAARAPAEPEALAAPEHEPSELPRGVSAPQPNDRDLAAPSAAAAKPATPSAAAKPSGVASQAKTIDDPAPPLAKKSPLSPKRAIAQSQPTPPRALAPAPPVPAEPIAPPPEPAPTPPRASVIVPQTDHVRVDVPSGLQHWLDEDDRMRPWLGKAVNVADSCYAKVRADNPNASGEIAFVVTMHENARPSGKVSSVSPSISGIVMCATTRLLGVKMPLFTGTEGESHTVRVRFEP